METILHLLLILYHNCVALSSSFSISNPHTILLGCGLVGAAGDLPHTFRTQVFKDFLDVCQVRGRDSTGVVKVSKGDQNYDWCKATGSPSYLYDGRQYEQRIESGDASVLIGHCRAKTVGEVSAKNAHPFDFPEEGICGVHNGTLRNHYRLPTHKHNMVDSEVMYAFLAQNGPEETFSTIEGAWACVWWNDKEKTLNFIRNDQRPLYFTWSEDARMMFWASEPWMFAAVERKVKLWDGGKKKEKIVALPINTLWSFKINAAAKGGEKVLNMRPAKKIAPAPEKKANTYLGGRTQTVIGKPHSDEWDYDPVSRSHRRRDHGGGEVKNPFLARVMEKYPGWNLLSIQEKQNLIRKEQEDRKNQPLNDQLSDLFGLTKDDPTVSDLSNVAFLNTSALPLDSTKQENSTTRQRKPLISLPGKSSSSSPQGSNVVPLGEPTNCCSSSRSTKTTLQLKSGVSHRVVAGVEYISDKKTSREWSSTEFIYNTNGICCFCKTQVYDIFEVGEILDENNFICETCLHEPKAVAL